MATGLTQDSLLSDPEFWVSLAIPGCGYAGTIEYAPMSKLAAETVPGVASTNKRQTAGGRAKDERRHQLASSGLKAAELIPLGFLRVQMAEVLFCWPLR